MTKRDVELLTRESLAAGAAQRWRWQYFESKGGEWTRDDKREIYARLCELGDSPSPDQVNEVIGNGSWTRKSCGLCHSSDTGPWLELHPGEYHGTILCSRCVTYLYEMRNEHTEDEQL